jgi:hypothetical protein
MSNHVITQGGAELVLSKGEITVVDLHRVRDEFWPSRRGLHYDERCRSSSSS